MKSRRCTDLRTSGLLSLIITFGVFPGLAAANGSIDCPMRDTPYSVDSPLIDVLLKPEARAIVEQKAPELLQGVPETFLSTTPPTFSAIVSLMAVGESRGMSSESLGKLNAALKQLPVTAADKKARCARYDVAEPELNIPSGKPRLLVFEKINGFRDGPSIDAGREALIDLANKEGWAIVVTDQGGAFTPETLEQFDAVIWNNVSGDALTLPQRNAFKSYIENGGGFVGLHGSGGDIVWFWDWYVDELIGARFAGHTMDPHFQDAQVVVEDTKSGIGRNLLPGWTMNDEWYSFKNNPRETGATVIATLDESTYSPEGVLRMGDHPIAWTRCLGSGRSFYSAIGHRPQAYSEPHHLQLLKQAIDWAAGHGQTICHEGREVLQK